ncbi:MULTISPECIES: hypothetical protein [Limnospira]|uniref:Tetratricopeptide TPR_2 repeat protein n=1 Tax=Limnospira maxima CS-328 TaxID=513049 RepID=B5W1M6_LIMMA|nr:hypothetical protein [Limnospira maxima]EDZ94636.1 Tetratricopeptide TPR_2 repeat protein [Limnospira maxima CS-328]MDC0840340.1 hypothetical protein [Limnoraphis robusta]QJB24849.1 hypothetical protein HFV01_02310 [Limnospira fusiformis SAG 85.79]RAQ44351.1 tetratricopeptide repeat protein [Arthrospira sp. O9.13F]
MRNLAHLDIDRPPTAVAVSQLNARAKADLAAGKLESAIAICHEAIKLQPDCFQTYCILGGVLQAGNQTEKAIRAYEQALELQPQAIEVYLSLEELYRQQGHRDRSDRCRQQIRELETRRHLIDGATQPNLNYLETSGWVQSLKLLEPVNGARQPIPWYNYPAIEFVENHLKPNFNVFEYGSGYSTQWYAERVARVIAVESDPSWYEKLRDRLTANTSIVLIEDEEKYAAKILDYPDCSFDIVVVDGINRNQCAMHSISKLKPTGFIIFDNTDRYIYDRGIKYLMNGGFKRIDFFGLVPTQTYKTCTSIFFRDDSFLKNAPLPSARSSCLGISLGYAEAHNRQYDSM